MRSEYIVLFSLFGVLVAARKPYSPSWTRKDKPPCPKYLSEPLPKPVTNGRISERKCEEYKWEIKETLRKEEYDICVNSRRGIINGVSSSIRKFPHMVSLGYAEHSSSDTYGQYEFDCGGSLISENFVLTAAHCNSIRKGLKVVRLGTSYINPENNNDAKKEEPKIIEIKRIIQHESYNKTIKYYDIALLELTEKVNFTEFMRPACLDSKPVDFTKISTIAGWGTIEDRTNKLPPMLQSSDIDLIDYENCSIYLNYMTSPSWSGVADHQLCAGKLDGSSDACTGDSGGPLMYKRTDTSEDDRVIINTIIGVISFGKNCAMTDSPAVYTKVSYFIDWIEKNVWPEDHQYTNNSVENSTSTKQNVSPKHPQEIIQEDQKQFNKSTNKAIANPETNLVNEKDRISNTNTNEKVGNINSYKQDVSPMQPAVQFEDQKIFSKPIYNAIDHKPGHNQEQDRNSGAPSGKHQDVFISFSIGITIFVFSFN